ncbi:FKBP-type peptidyl-prolyl cis-trans isomerase, partial [Acinetobacter nosocomialis]|uniref:FKBP-type peptidyl-prolyl cis-trans isomerase n=1 Tax=Acinetobacter nosocomialis TaxID=106654 RepID=UPI0030FAC4DA
TGWSEGLQLMKDGAKYRFFIPADLDYGQFGSGDIIESSSTLIFDIELLEIIK